MTNVWMKKTMKLTMMFGLVFVLAAALTACSSSDSSTEEDNTEETQVEETKVNIVGTWKGTAADGSESKIVVNDDKKLTIVDAKYFYEPVQGSSPVNVMVTEQEITSPDEDVSVLYDITINSDIEFQLTDNVEFGSQPVVYTKQ